ncbi:MAG: acyltransferase [Proteobacteria bacterium]|nr:acyltransferase [Pseudomonadota bacterium]
MRNSSAATGHFNSLDALRGIAAIGVALSHVGWITSLTNTRLLANAHLLVDFFFVLSGFVIAFNYADRLNNGTETARFVWLRFWRLYPLHFVMLLVFVVIEAMKWYAAHRYGLVPNQQALSTNTPTAFLTNMFLIQSFGFNTNDTFNGVSWSISTEFYAYLAFALIALVVRRRIGWAASAVVFATGLLVWRDGGSLSHTWDILAFNRCLFGFFLGVLVFVGYGNSTRLGQLPAGAAAALSVATIAALAIFLALKPNGVAEFLAPFLSAAIIFVLAATPRNAVSAALSTRPMIWLGQVSYSIYMVHLAILWSLAQFARVVLHAPSVIAGAKQINFVALPAPAGDILLVAAIGIVLLASHASYLLIEAPWRDWSRRYWPSRKTTPATT